MGRCVNHPDRETSYLCMKHNISMCGECLRCRDPRLYCKHRQACPIWFLTRHGDALGDDSRPADSPAHGSQEREKE